MHKCMIRKITWPNASERRVYYSSRLSAPASWLTWPRTKRLSAALMVALVAPTVFAAVSSVLSLLKNKRLSRRFLSNKRNKRVMNKVPFAIYVEGYMGWEREDASKEALGYVCCYDTISCGVWHIGFEGEMFFNSAPSGGQSISSLLQQ